MRTISRPVENQSAVVAALRRKLRQRGAAKRVAHAIGVTPSILCRVANGTIPPSDKVAAGLGYRRVSKWERIAREEELALADKIEAELNAPSILKECE